MWIESKKGKRRTSTPSRKVKFVTDSIEPWGWFINRSVWPRGSERDSGPNEAYNGCSSTVNHQINEPTIDQSNRSVHQTDEPDWTCRNIYKFIRLIFFPGTASCSADHDDPPPLTHSTLLYDTLADLRFDQDEDGWPCSTLITWFSSWMLFKSYRPTFGWLLWLSSWMKSITRWTSVIFIRLNRHHRSIDRIVQVLRIIIDWIDKTNTFQRVFPLLLSMELARPVRDEPTEENKGWLLGG